LRKLAVAMPSVLNRLGNASNVAFITTMFCVGSLDDPSTHKRRQMIEKL